MKLLMVGTDTASMANFRAPLLRDLKAQGVENLVLTAPVPEEKAVHVLSSLGVRYIESPMQRAGLSPLADLKLLFWLWRLLRREKPDVLFCFQAKAIIYGGLAGFLARVPVRAAMVEGLGLGFMKTAATFKQKLVQIVLPLLYRLGSWPAHVVFFLNPDDMAFFKKERFVHRWQKSVLIPGIGIDLAHFTPQPLPEGPMTFLMIARLIQEKGVRVFAEAARLVKAQRPDCRFVLLGPEETGPAGVPLSEVMTWHHEGYLTYAGTTNDVRPFLAACHVFVLPSYREGLPRSTMEAMATGRAIITTNVPGAKETVLDQVNGYLIKPQSAGDLAKAILLLASDLERVKSFGAASRQMAEQKFEVRAVNRQIIEALLPKHALKSEKTS